MHRFSSLLAAGALFLCADAFAVQTFFLCVTEPGYPGDSLDLANCSDVFDVTNTGFVDGALPVARDIKLVKRFDSMSLPLRRAMVNNTMLNEVKIRMFTGTTMLLEFEDIRLREVHVVAASFADDASNTIQTDNIAFTASRIEYTFHRQNQNGTLASAIVMCWDVANQTASSNTCQ